MKTIKQFAEERAALKTQINELLKSIKDVEDEDGFISSYEFEDFGL